MAFEKSINTLIFLYVYSLSLTIAACQECDESKCPGPLAYYKSLGCTPVYDGTENTCCAVKYNCDLLKNRSIDKCYLNGNIYNLDEPLKEEDANPCDIGCKCVRGFDNIATFTCSVVDCFQGPPKPGCYRENSPLECCPGEEKCPGSLEDRAICLVDGKVYRDGEYFQVESDPTLSCVCQPGYLGNNVEPFCRSGQYCRPEMRHAADIHNNCAPVYYSTQSPQTDCSVFSRCQNANDTVVRSETDTVVRSETAPDSQSDSICTFGNLTMNLGDELNQSTDYSSACVKCVCEVPPRPTCQRLPDEECDVTAVHF